MKKLFAERVFDILPVENGFVVVYEKAVVEDKMIVSFKSVSTENGVVEQRTKGDYMFVKFGPNYKEAMLESGNYINTKTAHFDEKIFVSSPSGEAKIIDAEGNTTWSGNLRYKDVGPDCVVAHGHTIWASFSEENVIIRFNLNTMREELRIGGSRDSAFNKPTGLWIDRNANTMLVCNSRDNNLLEVNLKTYSVYEYHKFEKPITNYIKVGANEIVILDSQLYKL